MCAIQQIFVWFCGVAWQAVSSQSGGGNFLWRRENDVMKEQLEFELKTPAGLFLKRSFGWRKTEYSKKHTYFVMTFFAEWPI